MLGVQHSATATLALVGSLLLADAATGAETGPLASARQAPTGIVLGRHDLSIDVDAFEKPDYIARRIAGSVTQDWTERNRTSIGYSWQVPMKPHIPEHWQKPLVQSHRNWGAIIGHARSGRVRRR